MDQYDSFRTLSYAIPAVIAVLTVPSLLRLGKATLRWRAKPHSRPALYEDKDGVASSESMSSYSTKLSFISISVLLALALGASFALSVFATVRRDFGFTRAIIGQIWSLLTAWLLVLVQVVDTVRETAIVARVTRGIFTSISCILIVVLCIAIPYRKQQQHPGDIVFSVLVGVQMLASVLMTFIFFSIQRRPDVFRPDGRVVERQYTKSFISKYSLNWASEVLDLAATKLVDVSDLPALDHRVRAKDAKEAFKSIVLKPTVSLWIQIFWAYRGSFVFQWVITCFSSLVDAAPQFAVLRLLQYLESRETFSPFDFEAWLWVGLLFLATLTETIVDNRIAWLMWSDIALPIRSNLTALLFEKMLKAKDCKVPPKAENDEEKAKDTNGATTSDNVKDIENPVTKDSTNGVNKANGATNSNGVAKSGKPAKSEATTDGKEDEESEIQKNVINMFASDTQLVAHSAAMSQFYVMFVSKFIVTVAFLLFLIGWKSLGLGLVASAAFYPINKYLVNRYKVYQKALMKIRDKKTTLVTESLTGIRQIKFSNSEDEWTRKINEVRQEELNQLWLTKLNNLFMQIGYATTPVLLTTFSLATYSYLHGTLLPSIAFTALAVLMQLEGVLSWIPLLAMIGLNGKVSCDRIEKYLNSEDKPQTTSAGHSIAFDHCSITFPTMNASTDSHRSAISPTMEDSTGSTESEPDRFVLRDLNLEFPNTALSVISGPTGSGKSLLLAAILGEIELIQGNITVPRCPPEDQFFDDKATAADWIIPTAMAYVSQQPWIENATIKNNILFGLPYDAARYDKVITACALTRDLNMLEDGDQTEVGSQGINLSGGQKWRLCLARAFYSRAGILVLDDVFSALDAHVGREIFENALTGDLSEGRTRILVTHHVSLCLPRAEYAVRLSARGALEFAGPVAELQRTDGFENMIKSEENADNPDPECNPLSEEEGQINGDENRIDTKRPKKLVEEEKRETGHVKKAVYTAYLKATGGVSFWLLVLVFYVGAQGSVLARSWWIKLWTASYEPPNAKFNHMHHEYAIQTQLISPYVNSTARFLAGDNEKLGYYLSGYILISLVSTLVDVARYFLVYWGAFRASTIVFREMTHQVLRTPMRWLDVTPIGRIINRFTADFQSFDSALSSNLAQTSSAFLQTIGIMVAAFFVSPYIIIFALVLLGICGRMGQRYLVGARSIKRLTSIQKSPMISHFSTSLQGLATIRAFSKSNVFEDRMHELTDSFTSAIWHNYLFSTWVGFRMAMVGTVFSLAVASFIVSTPGVDASLAGFALAFALSYRRTVNRLIKFMASTELDFNSAERIFEYTGLQIETQEGVEDLRASWPENGVLEVDNLEVGYAEGLPSILKGLSFSAQANNRVGIVGRTGAGKSTLSLALFRFLEARKGTIYIDGIDISTIKLHDLRSRLAIIPQDPVLFSGSIRSNLDPFNQYSDYQLKEVLQRVHLIPSADTTPVPELANTQNEEVSAGSSTDGEGSSATAFDQSRENVNPFLSLSYPISSGGSNLSQGQKQLLCLARAILSRPKLLLLDEATSAVDIETDTLIQRSIREEFKNTTLLVVAHRLSTVADFDKILVVSDGTTAEWGSPSELMKKEDGKGWFKGMVEKSGERAELERIILGEDKEKS